MSEPIYVLDSNIFIEAARHYYAFDLAPKFWQSLKDNSDAGRLRSIDRVKSELERGNDELAEWATTGCPELFDSTDDPGVISAFRNIMIWVQSQGQFMDAAKTQFASCADGWLVAYAIAHGCTVVTHETLAPERRNKVQIPNVCQAFNVSWVNTFAMLRALGVRLG